jgi:hypothetical protein
MVSAVVGENAGASPASVVADFLSSSRDAASAKAMGSSGLTFGAPQEFVRHSKSRKMLPDNLTGLSVVLEAQVMGLTYYGVEWQNSIALPLNYTEALSTTMRTVRFDNGLADPSPTMAVPRSVERHTTTRTISSVRYAVSVDFEFDQLHTPEGRENFNQSLIQLRNRYNNNLMHYAQQGIDNADPEEDAYRRAYRQPTDMGHVRNIIERERREFGILQKTARGFSVQYEIYAQRMKAKAGVSPDLMICDPRDQIFWTMESPILPFYELTGPSGTQRYQFQAEVGMGSFRGCNVVNPYIPNSDEFDEEEAAKSPMLEDTRRIGNVFPMPYAMHDDHNEKFWSAFVAALALADAAAAPGAKQNLVDNYRQFGRLGGDYTDELMFRALLEFGASAANPYKTSLTTSPIYDESDTDGYFPIKKPDAFQHVAFQDDLIALPDSQNVSAGVDTPAGRAAQTFWTGYKRPSDRWLFVQEYNDGRWGRNGFWTKDKVQKLFAANVPVPLDIVVTRPFMGYTMSSVILMKGGKETGTTNVGHVDLTLSSDGANKTSLAHASFYMCAVIRRPERIMRMPFVSYKSAEGGAGSRFYTAEDLENLKDAGWRVTDKNAPSLIPIARVPGNDYGDLFDLTGSLSAEYGTAGEMYDASHEMRTRFLGLVSPLSVLTKNGTTENNVANTLCWQGSQFYSTLEPGKYNLRVSNKGHHGPYEYTGCRDIRNGQNGVVDPEMAKNIQI